MGWVSAWRARRTLGGRVKGHFAPAGLGGLVVAERKFPSRVRADLQRALEELFAGGGARISYFSGVAVGPYGMTGSLALLGSNVHAIEGAAPLYEEVDIGEGEPVRCLQSALWLGEAEGAKFVLLLTRSEPPMGDGSLKIQAGVAERASLGVVERVFDHLGEAVRGSRSYRGKVLSLGETSAYSGEAQGIKVHRLRGVAREEVILPRETLELLERNVLGFVARRERLGRCGQSRKKGLLFYGPPGTGKTHTIHYLAGALKGHTTFLISAEQVGLLSEYMTLARLLQPSMVVIEDADLIARERQQMQSVCEEVLLNKLLNEMDGLTEDADVLFVLTTNRPEALEGALTARPGRIDQAIEFPLPDAEGRRKLVGLYGRGMKLEAEVVEEIVRRTEKVSAAFIKELMRRAVQFQLERVGEGEDGAVGLGDVREALEEMVHRGGALNVKLLGGGGGGGG